MEVQEYTEDIDFQKYWLILKRHWLPGTVLWSLVVMGSIFSAMSAEKSFEAYGKLRFKRQNTVSALVTEAGEKIGKLDPLNTKDTPLDTEAEVIRSEPIIEQTIKAANLRNKKGKLESYEGFLKNLDVKNIRGTDILLISYKNVDPQVAKLVVDKLMETYIKNNILVNRAEAAAAKKFINKQLPESREKLLQTELALRKFKEKFNIIDLDQEAKLTVSRLSDLNNQIQQTKADIQKITGQTVELQKKIGVTSEQAVLQSNITNSSGIQQALAKLQEVENQLAIERSRFLEDSPVISDLKSKKADLEALVNQRLSEVSGQQEVSGKIVQSQAGNLQNTLVASLVNYESERRGLVTKLSSLEQQQIDLQTRANFIPKLQQLLLDLERQQKSAQSTYESLINNLQQVEIIENQNLGNAEIVNQGLASKYPINKSSKAVVGMGVALGGMIYVVVAFGLELMDKSLKTTKEIRSIFAYTLLGMIPGLKRKNMFPGMKAVEQVPAEYQVRDHSHSLTTETYKMLQANLRFLNPDRDLKVIVVTSSVPKEGKSTVSANLAVAIAQLDQRVLLIDADLHHPQQHHIWDLTNEAGLTEVIVNRTESKKVIKEVMPNLDVLPSGVIPPNSLALLNSQRMNSLISDFRKNYDFIIIDTPPLLLVADAITVNKMTDGILLVARPGVIDKPSAIAAKDVLTQSRQNVLGLVVNGILIENEPDSYFHHAKSYSGINANQNLNFRFKSKV
ncbi:GumC family protein [Aerosakkonemataceae cyanobacterium BLCC-F154]|uniref:non-specific protein-tyrosine kinase n=1 Tax=Floridaenema fluviatile BLCC-F154 TaxID=3153640 RepID=A0ABV4YIK7_9CYAN